MNTNPILIEIKDLTVTFSRWGQSVIALDHLSLTIPKAQWVMLVGHNGSGKSTLLKSISRRLTPNTGEIFLGGKQASQMRSSEIAEQVFHVHQDPLLGTAPKLTLFENLMVADHQAQVEDTPKRKLYDKYRVLLQPFGIDDRLKQLAQNLSGGERQLVAMVIARMRPSFVMLLDEPLAALDPSKSQECLNEIGKMHEEGKTILQVTHDPLLAVNGGERTIILANGSVAYDKLGEERNIDDIRSCWTATTTWRKSR